MFIARIISDTCFSYFGSDIFDNRKYGYKIFQLKSWYCARPPCAPLFPTVIIGWLQEVHNTWFSCIILMWLKKYYTDLGWQCSWKA